MRNLMEACCQRCTHTPASPCSEYLLCRTEGPLCHESKECRQQRKAFIDEVTIPSDSPGRQIIVCGGTGCTSSGAANLVDLLNQEITAHNLGNSVQVKKTSCHGFCENGPILHIKPEGIFYTKVKPKDIQDIVLSHLVNQQVVKRLLYQDTAGNSYPYFQDIPFYAGQTRLLLRNCGQINPESLADYLAVGGYRSLVKVLQQMTPDEVIEEVQRSGLRGRGGAGFPTGRKWASARKAAGDVKYIICNADEGDPGAFMDRSLLEGDPHSVLEGMLIAGFAVGSTKGYIYCRAEYPLAIKRLKIAIHQAQQVGLLGSNIMGSGFQFDIALKEGAGAFVCGEGTALQASIEGLRGMPRVKPPRSTEKGLWEKPTVLNNVETLANIPVLIQTGTEAYRKLGTVKSPGTKIFALSGAVTNPGLVEIPMGQPLREIIFGIGGGIRDGKSFKAVQLGGPSGGCLTEQHLELPVDFDSLTTAGATIGSGGMVVMGEDTCMVDVARFFLAFTQAESCGKCTPCREGTKRMLEILERICQGKADLKDLGDLERLCRVVKNTSLCGLGQACPNPVLSTLQYFREEYLAHIVEKRCPAGVCSSLVRYSIAADRCRGCGLCLKNCPVGAIEGEKKQPHTITAERCIKCGVCLDKCKFGAVLRG
ncbi:NADH-quinone oxidoreductase subunit NuoF [Desulforamulus aeronauticus]|uniref:NADH-quinone oxidoreductase subunit F n=1 Tax=Desulforamulus aeronauticus DSM 10349 TaxID=1121421 RepID=A0A1M6PBJ3_9FIRM|nr:NADH-quinone oxidoreductase subunit NuoF [Desulforamulus aeronauticus]SHK05294.1 NADH-quinone oxidoreductase subunit F [Desulforamulus aeronauticus DSM 10349]